MTDALIVYGSTTGNSKNTADIIKKTLKSKGYKVTKKNVSAADIDELDKEYDLMIFGCSTWSFDEEDKFELQSGFLPFFDKMGKHKFKNKKIGVFGCGDSSYKHFCSAVNKIEDLVTKNDGQLAGSSLKVDGNPYEHDKEIKKWVNTLANL